MAKQIYKMEVTIEHYDARDPNMAGYYTTIKDYGTESNFKRAKALMEKELREEPGARSYMIINIENNKFYASQVGYWQQGSK